MYKPNTVARITTRSGAVYVAKWTLAPGIDWFWNPLPLPGQPTINHWADPDERIDVLYVADN